MSKVQGQPLKTLSNERALQQINQGTRRTHRIEIEIERGDETLKGTVVVHHPSQMERIQIGVLKAHLLGGLPSSAVDQMTENLVTIIATLDIATSSAPDWFNVYAEDIDYDLLEGVYIEYMNWVKTFRTGTRAKSSEGTSQE